MSDKYFFILKSPYINIIKKNTSYKIKAVNLFKGLKKKQSRFNLLRIFRGKILLFLSS